MDDDFFYDSESFDEDVKLSVVEETELKLTTAMEKLAKEMSMNLKLNETTDFRANVEIMARHLDNLISMMGIEDEGLSDEEILEKVDEIFSQTTELTLQNIDTVLKDLNEDTGAEVNTTDNPADNGCDW